MKIKVFLILLAFASSAFAQVCPNETTVGKFVNPLKEQRNWQNLNSVCGSDKAIENEVNLNATAAYASILFSSSINDDETLTIAGVEFEFNGDSNMQGNGIEVDISGGGGAGPAATALFNVLETQEDLPFTYTYDGDTLLAIYSASLGSSVAAPAVSKTAGGITLSTTSGLDGFVANEGAIVLQGSGVDLVLCFAIEDNTASDANFSCVDFSDFEPSTDIVYIEDPCEFGAAYVDENYFIKCGEP